MHRRVYRCNVVRWVDAALSEELLENYMLGRDGCAIDWRSQLLLAGPRGNPIPPGVGVGRRTPCLLLALNGGWDCRGHVELCRGRRGNSLFDP